MKKEKAALVLSGGAALGAVELGILSVLEKQYEFDFVAGTSIGSLIGGLFLQGKNAQTVFEIFDKKMVREMLLMDMSATGFGFLKGEKFLSFLREQFQDQSFDDLSCPFWCVATDFSNGDRLNLHTGSVAEAIRASCGIPLLFRPYEHSTLKKWLVDGGLCQNFPLDIALKEYTGQTIIGIDVGTFVDESEDFSNRQWFTNVKKIAPTIQRSLRIMMKNQHVTYEDDRVQLFCPDVTDFSPMKFRQKNFDTMFLFGQEFARNQLLTSK